MPADGPGRLQSGEPSATAMGVAMRRAAHQLFDDPKVFDDPLATRIIGGAALERLKGELDGISTRSTAPSGPTSSPAAAMPRTG